MTYMNNRMRKGMTMVEVVIASAIILSAVVVLSAVHNLYLKSALSNGGILKSAYLAEEGIEAMRYLRDDSWSAQIGPLSSGTDYGLSLSGSAWQTGTGNQWIDGFERAIRVGNVSRDANGDIVSSGGTLDPDTRLVTVSVSWQSRGATTTRAISTYLTNLRGN
jgi:prepilin-type N-terminal cleavage/methylation domain-containing protein